MIPRTTRSKQPLNSKENVDDALGPKKSSKTRANASKLQTTKGNKNLINSNPISILQSPVLRDRTNLTLEPTKVLLKQGKNEKAAIMRNIKITRTRSNRLQDSGKSENVEFATDKKKSSRLSKLTETVKEKQQMDPIPSTSREESSKIVKNKVVRSTSKTEKDVENKKRNETDFIDKNKKQISKTVSEVEVVSKVSTRSKKSVSAKATEPSLKQSRKLIPSKSPIKATTRTELMRLIEANTSKESEVVSKLSTKSKKSVSAKVTEPSLKQSRKLIQRKSPIKATTRTALMRLIKADGSQESDVSSKNAEKQKKDKDSKVENEDKSSEAKEELEKPKKPLTRSKKSIEANTNDKSKSSEISEKSIPVKKSLRSSKTPIKKSLKVLSPKISQRKVSMRVNNADNGQKFFKNRQIKPSKAHSKISPLKRAVIGISQKNTRNKKARVVPVERESSSFRLRQTTLNELFLNHSKKSLRPRNNKNYCEESRIVNNSLDEKKCVLQLENINEKVGPVYKRVNFDESKEKDKEKVYEFISDQSDNVRKKRKKRVVREVKAKKKKVTAKSKTVAKATKNTGSAKPTDNIKVDERKPTNKAKANDKKSNIQKPVVISKTSKPTDKIASKHQVTKVTAEIYSPPSPHIGYEADANNDNLQAAANSPTKLGPRIILDQELKRERCINITGTPLQPKSKEEQFSRPFRATNAFNMKPSMQVKTMMDHSLLRRSLSPISKESTPAIIQDSSPWRPILPASFSRVKNVFQSTPQGEKFTAILLKPTLISNKQPFSARMNKIVEQNNENDAVLKDKSPLKKNSPLMKKKTSPMKNNISPVKKSSNTSNSPRKFGTQISNRNSVENSPHLSPSKSPRKFGNEVCNVNKLNTPKSSSVNNKSPGREATVENSVSVIELTMRISPAEELADIDDILENKENSAPNDQSPNNTVQELGQVESSNLQQERRPDDSASIEEFEPQPGPSGLQKSSPLIDTWNLKQSNLNKFLKLPDMPQSTRISTAQGIFDDAHSTPIDGRATRRYVAQFDAANAFGFDDSDELEEIDNISPINRQSRVLPQVSVKKLIEHAEKRIQQAQGTNPARLISIGEIKKSLRINALKKAEIVQTDNVPAKHEFHGGSKKDVVQAISFSDTFDIMNNEENQEGIEENIKEVPLFVDLEPVHFTQPPRFLYKRKRHEQLHTSGETEDEHDDEEEHHQKRANKKRKVGKAERVQKKKVDEWAKSMNETFDAIDHFNLVVE